MTENSINLKMVVTMTKAEISKTKLFGQQIYSVKFQNFGIQWMVELTFQFYLQMIMIWRKSSGKIYIFLLSLMVQQKCLLMNVLLFESWEHFNLNVRIIFDSDVECMTYLTFSKYGSFVINDEFFCTVQLFWQVPAALAKIRNLLSKLLFHKGSLIEHRVVQKSRILDFQNNFLILKVFKGNLFHEF